MVKPSSAASSKPRPRNASPNACSICCCRPTLERAEGDADGEGEGEPTRTRRKTKRQQRTARQDAGPPGSRRARRPHGRAERRAASGAGADFLQPRHGEHGRRFPEHVRKDHAQAKPAAAGADPRGPHDFAGTGNRGLDRPPDRDRKSGRAGRESGHHLHRRARQGLRPRVGRTAPMCRARACSAICCRWSKARRSTRATARCAPTTSSSSRRGRSTCRSRRT